MAKSSEDQIFEEIHNYQAPGRPDLREYYRSSQGREVGLDFFLYSCLEEEQTSDALPREVCRKLAEKRWPPLRAYVREEVFDERDERVQVREVEQPELEELFREICSWYQERYPQLSGGEPLDYAVLSGLISEFVLMSRDLRLVARIRGVSWSDRPRKEEGLPEDTVADFSASAVTELPASRQQPDPGAGGKADADAPEPLLQAEELPCGSSDSPDEDGHEILGAGESSEDMAAFPGQQEEAQAEFILPPQENRPAESGQGRTWGPNYGELLEQAFREFFPSYARLMSGYLNWQGQKKFRPAPNLADLPPVGRYLSLLRRGSGHYRDGSGDRRGAPPGRRMKAEPRRGAEGPGKGSDPEREGQAIKDVVRALSVLKKNPHKKDIRLSMENSFIRRIQHDYIRSQQGFTSVSVGEGQQRAVQIQRQK